MKKILLSAGMIVFMGALLAGATGAFFSDSETSTGNTFTAGAIDLLVDSQAHYAGLECIGGVWVVEDQEDGTTREDLIGDACSGTWEMTDLGPANTFFNLGDLKPGDEGENTISLHVNNNDAYVCAIIDNLVDNDNGVTEPEGDDGDVTPGPLGGGELSSELRFTAWSDTGSDGVFDSTVESPDPEEGDNVWQAAEVLLFSNDEGPASDVFGGVSYPLYTPLNGAMPAGSTSYIGLAWCYGDIDVSVPGTITCDGSNVNNLTQTDSMTADISFYVEQSRNNDGFVCPTPEQFDPEEPVDVWTEVGTRTGGDVETVADETTETGNNVLKLTTINDTDSRVRYNHAESMDVADVDGFSYDSKQVSAIDAVNGNATFRIVVDLDGNLLTLGDVTDVTFEPYYNILAHNTLNDAAITTGAWQNWAATRTEGKFWAAGVTTSFGVSEGAGGAYATNFTLDALTAAYPNAKVVGINIGMGTYNVGQVVHVDNLIFDGVMKGFE